MGTEEIAADIQRSLGRIEAQLETLHATIPKLTATVAAVDGRVSKLEALRTWVVTSAVAGLAGFAFNIKAALLTLSTIFKS